MNDFNWDKGYSDGTYKIPEYMIGALKRYVMFGMIPDGDFLKAVIKNDLFKAVGHADSANLKNLPAYVRFFYNEAPGQCHGSGDDMRYWKRVRGWNGLVTLDVQYPKDGGLCTDCPARDECPVPGLIKDTTMALPRPTEDENGEIIWCPIYGIEEEEK